MTIGNAFPDYIHDFQPLRNAQSEYWGKLGIHNGEFSTKAVNLQATGYYRVSAT